MNDIYAQTLLKPLVINNLHLANRVVMAPMSRYQSPNGVPTKETAQYYRRRAEGGVGLIITEGTVIDHKASYDHSDVPHLYGEALTGWRNVVNEVHAAGGKIFSQLWHVGSVRQMGSFPDSNVPGYAPSAIVHPHASLQQAPYAMSVADIQEVIQAFALAAFNAKLVGFDGIEIHGAHGFLIDQFLWSHTNQRSDQYGGKTLKDRMRFAIEVVQAIRQAVGKNYPVSFRLSQWKMGAYEAKSITSPTEFEQLLLPLVDAGVDLFHCSTRRFYEAEFVDSNLNLAGWAKKITGKPAITVGGVGLDNDFVNNFVVSNNEAHFEQNNIDLLLKKLEQQEFDLVAVGRALLSDANWLQKITEQRFDEINVFNKKSLQTFY